MDEPPVESLPDRELLAVCDATLTEVEQDALTALLSRHGEGSLSAAETARLDALMAAYRQGLVVKARALREAVARGLRPSLADDGDT